MRVKVVQNHRKWYQSKPLCNFLLAVYSNLGLYVPPLQRYCDAKVGNLHFFRFYQLYVVSAQAAITQSPSTYVQKLQVSEVVDETISRSCVSSYHVLARSYVQTRGGSCLLVPRRLNFFETQINVMRNCVKRNKIYDRKSRITNLLLLLCAYVPPPML